MWPQGGFFGSWPMRLAKGTNSLRGLRHAILLLMLSSGLLQREGWHSIIQAAASRRCQPQELLGRSVTWGCKCGTF